MAFRDEAADTARGGEAGGLGRNDVPTHLGRDYQANYTIEDEILAGGWIERQQPWPPRTDRVCTSGGAGDPDLDDDSYGVFDRD